MHHPQRPAATWKLDASLAPQATVLTGRAFARQYDCDDHSTLFLMVPLLSPDGRSGLLAAQHELASKGSAMATDYWVWMRRSEEGSWTRVPVPEHLRQRLYLTEQTGG